MEEKINTKIAETKTTIKEITKHFNYDEEVINILTIVYLSMIMLDDEIEDLLREALSKTYILFTSNPIEEIYQKLLGKKLFRETLIQLKQTNSAYFGSFIVNEQLVNENLIIIGPSSSFYEKVEDVIHELKHAINEVLPEFCSCNEPYFYSGLAQETSYGIKYDMIDEAFNSYLTKIYLDNINFLKKFSIQDLAIKKILKDFKLPKNYHYAYENITILCEPLFSSKYLFKKFYYSSLYKSFYELDRALYHALGETQDSIDFFSYLDKIYYSQKDITEIENIDYSVLRERVKIKPYFK